MKGVILAAGMGTRLGELTKNKPKGLLEFQGKSLIEWELKALRSTGIKEIIVIRGYMAKKIDYPNIKYYNNKNYANTNMVESLMCARKELKGPIIVSYADILYEKRVVEELIKAKGKIVVTVDTAWREYWKARIGTDKKDIESLKFGEQGDRITLIGSKETNPKNIDGRYVGLIKFSAKGIEILKKVYKKEKEKYEGGKWKNSKSFAQGYMTDILQAIIDTGYKVKPLKINHGWLEFDNVQDYQKTSKWAKEGSLQRFFELGQDDFLDLRNEIKYRYLEQDQLEKPINYSFSIFEGPKFLEAFLESRKRCLGKIKEALKHSDEKIESTKSVRKPKNAVDSNKALQEIFFRLKSKKCPLKKIKPSLDFFVKKYETTKKIHSWYSEKPRKSLSGSFDQMKNYSLLSLNCLKFYEKRSKLKYLNCALKVDDLICSRVKKLKEKDSLELAKKALAKEIKIVEKLIEEKIK